MNITYFINHYPKVSHTFIRREIQALENLGVKVNRIAIHRDDISDQNNPDFEEVAKTTYIFEPSYYVLIEAFIAMLFGHFTKVLSGFLLCLKMIRVSDRSAVKNVFYFLEGLRLAKLCSENGTEHIHAHFGTNSTDVVMYCSHVSGIPYSFTVHGPEEFDRPFSINLKEKIERASLVFAITKFCKSQLQRWVSHSQWNKIKIIHCGLDKNFFDSDLPIKPINKSDVNALFIGRLCEQKGPLVLMKALKLLSQKGIVLRVVFAGDGELRGEIETFARQHDLSDSITITGWVDSTQIKSLLLQSDFMVLPSFAEGLPVAIMEALATKVPVISTRIAGIPELLRDKETGFVVSPGCEFELAHAIETLLSMEQLQLNHIIDQAYAAVHENHSADTEAVKIKHLLTEALS